MTSVKVGDKAVSVGDAVRYGRSNATVIDVADGAAGSLHLRIDSSGEVVKNVPADSWSVRDS